MNLMFASRKKIVSPHSISSFITHFAKDDNWHNLDINTYNLGYGWIHYSYIRNLKPNRVLCIGSRYGFIPAVCALACKDNQKGIVDFVDAGFDQDDKKDDLNHWGGVGFWKSGKVGTHFSQFGLEKHIKVHVMTSLEFKKNYKRRKWEYIYLDGDHSYKGVRTDYRLFWNSLKKGGFMSLHDINNLGTQYKEDYGVWRFWKEIKKEQNSIEFPGEFGLGILQK